MKNLESIHSPGFLEKHGQVGGLYACVKVIYKAAFMHDISTMKCIALD